MPVHDVIKSLIVDYSQDVSALGFDKKETSLHVASRGCQCSRPGQRPLHLTSDGGHVEVARALLEHRAGRETRDKYDCSQLERASVEGVVGVVWVLLRHSL